MNIFTGDFLIQFFPYSPSRGHNSYLIFQMKANMQISRLYAVKRFLINVNFILLYPTQRVAEGIIFYPSFRLSVSQSVRQSCFSCQRNSSEATQQNFVKLCSYEEQCVDVHIYRKFWLNFFLGVMPLFELRKMTKIKDTTQNRWSAQRHQNRSTEFHETL